MNSLSTTLQALLMKALEGLGEDLNGLMYIRALTSLNKVDPLGLPKSL
jgi:hypothetical protein